MTLEPNPRDLRERRAGGAFGVEAALFGVKVALSVALILAGWTGVSDDDYSRVVYAQRFAASPSFDPGESSWLPLPFWFYGAIMRLLGPSLALAQAIAVMLAGLSVVLIYRGAKKLDSASAFGVALIAALLPTSMMTGASTVPELPSAALTFYAFSTLASPRRSDRVGGALALLAASLCRYEVWIACAAFSAFCLYRAIKERTGERALGLALALLPWTGPSLWFGWNRMRYGTATHFLTDVSAYKNALDHASSWSRATEYLRAFARTEPELLVASALLGVFLLRRGRRPSPEQTPLLVGALTVFSVLSLANLAGGAPTHHAERPLLFGMMVLAAMVGAVASKRRWGLGLVGVGLALAGLRATFVRFESVAARADDVEVGRLVRDRTEGKVLIEVVDYGYFATMAASERPDDFRLSAPFEPWKGPPPPMDLAPLARELGAGAIVHRRSSEVLGEATVCARNLCLTELH